MQININNSHIDVSPALQEYTNTKFARLERHFDRITSINVSYAIEKNRHIAKATIHVPGSTIHADSETDDIYSAIDTLIDKLDRQLKEHKEKITNHHPHHRDING